MNKETQNPLEKLSLDQLNHRAETLREICLKIDPYSPLEPQELANLKKMGIKEVEDPFRLTNQLILHMEDTLEEILKREKKKSLPHIH